MPFWKKTEKQKLPDINPGIVKGSPLSSPTKKVQHYQLANGEISPTVTHHQVKSPHGWQHTSVPALKDTTYVPRTIARKSRLALTLEGVIQNQSALSHFIQFLAARNATHLIQFWLDAESFRASASSRLCSSHTLLKVSPHGTHTPKDLSRGLSQKIDLVIKVEANVMFASTESGTSVDSLETSPENHSSVKNIDRLTAASPMDAVQTSDDVSLLSAGSEGSLEMSDLRTPSPRPLQSSSPQSGSQVICDDPQIAYLRKSEHIAKEKCIESILERLHRSVQEDAVTIFSKYIAKDATLPIGISDAVRDEVTGLICGENSYVDPACFTSAQKWVMDCLEKKYFSEFIRSVYYCKYQIGVLTERKVTLDDILYNELSLLHFIEFMEQDCSRNLVEFWLAVDNFAQILETQQGHYDPIQVQEDAMVLYDKYFSLQATCPLGFGDSIRFEIEANICREGGPLPSCFDTPTQMIFSFLEKNYLPPFLDSQLFIKYLNELVNAVETKPSHRKERRYSGESDCSSEHSHGSQAGLLAADSPCLDKRNQHLVKGINSRDMQIDARKFNPDVLWKRPLSGKLSLGYVNELGQFVTDFEPEPDKRSGGSMFSKAVKRLVLKEEDKSKEELALHVAQMIIQEVKSVTMNDHVQRENT